MKNYLIKNVYSSSYYISSTNSHIRVKKEFNKISDISTVDSWTAIQLKSPAINELSYLPHLNQELLFEILYQIFTPLVIDLEITSKLNSSAIFFR